jgi:hypothetical protein
MRQLLAMDAICRHYMWIPGPMPTVYDEPAYGELTGVA